VVWFLGFAEIVVLADVRWLFDAFACIDNLCRLVGFWSWWRLRFSGFPGFVAFVV